jgi:hypothetical protein
MILFALRCYLNYSSKHLLIMALLLKLKINPSNSIVIDSENVKLAATADSVYVSCWEYHKMKKNIGSFMRVRMIIVLDNIISR